MTMNVYRERPMKPRNVQAFLLTPEAIEEHLKGGRLLPPEFSRVSAKWNRDPFSVDDFTIEVDHVKIDYFRTPVWVVRYEIASALTARPTKIVELLSPLDFAAKYHGFKCPLCDAPSDDDAHATFINAGDVRVRCQAKGQTVTLPDAYVDGPLERMVIRAKAENMPPKVSGALSANEPGTPAHAMDELREAARINSEVINATAPSKPMTTADVKDAVEATPAFKDTEPYTARPDRVTTDGKPARPGFEAAGAPAPLKANGQHEAYWVLSAAERAKGFVRPVRLSYRHVGRPGPKHPLRDLTPEEDRRFNHEEPSCGYVQFEVYPESDLPARGRYWTQAELDVVDKGCGATTEMSRVIAETYARIPGFYGATFCIGCKKHLPVGADGEFVWETTANVPVERVGT